MPRVYDESLRWRVIRLSLRGASVQEICDRLEVSAFFVKKIRKLYVETGSVQGKVRLGRSRELSARAILLLHNLVDEHPELFFDEIAEWLQFLTGRNNISVSMIERVLQGMGYSRRKLQIIAKQRNEIERAQFRRKIAAFRRDQLLFIDESSKDNRNLQRKYGRGLQGTKVSTKGYFVRGTRYSVLGGICTQGAFGHCIVGSYNREQFEYAVEQFVLPYVGSLAKGEPNSVVIMDNCRIHDSGRVLEMVRERGGIVIFLPPYSPDFNPIEKAFNIAKTWIARNKQFCYDNPKRCFEYALSQIQPDVCISEFNSCGYAA